MLNHKKTKEVNEKMCTLLRNDYFSCVILVTGGTGLVGSHLLYHLSLQESNIVAIYREGSNLEAVKNVFSYYCDTVDALFSKIIWKKADITDVTSLTQAFKNISYVYHCAALISFDDADYKAMRKINIEGTANIVNLCIENAVKKLCFVSSIAAVGKSLSGKEITEENEWSIEDKNYGYAITKYGAEIEVWRASQEGVPVIIVNPGVILGAGFWKNGSGKLFSSIYNGLRFYTNGVTGFVGVSDLATIMIALVKSNIANERYILISENRSYKSIFDAIADGFSKKRPFIKTSKLATELVWRLGKIIKFITGRQVTLTKQAAKSAHSKNYFSNAKIISAINYTFESVDKTISITCNQYLKK